MTQAELEAIPDKTPGFGIREETLGNGQILRIPVLESGLGVWYHPEDDPVSAVDVHGDRWMLGRGPNGVLYKRRA